MNCCLTKQVDMYPMSDIVSVGLRDSCYTCEMGEDVVVTAKRILYKRYGNGIYIRRKILGMNYSKN